MTAKRRLARMAAALACVLALAGCTNAAGQNFNKFVEDWYLPGEEGGASATQAEIVQYNSPAFGPTLGFDVTEYPRTSGFAPDKFYSINWFGQLEYRLPDERLLVVRAAREEDGVLADLYQEKHNTTVEVMVIEGIDVRVGTSVELCTLITWSRDGYQYSVHARPGQGRPPDAEIRLLVEGLACKEV